MPFPNEEVTPPVTKMYFVPGILEELIPAYADVRPEDKTKHNRYLNQNHVLMILVNFSTKAT